MDHALSVYLPEDRRHALAMGTSLPEHTQGAALFADISGFTTLTEALTRELGPRRGAEELGQQLNRVYDALIQEVDQYGGSVLDFAGDGITCWFDRDTGRRATACGLAMQQAMKAFAAVPLGAGGTATLALKVAVASGPVRRFLVGDPAVQLVDVLAGATLSRMAAAGQVTARGEVVLDEATALALGEALEVQGWRPDESGARFALVVGLRGVVAPQPWPPLPAGHLGPTDLRPWVPLPVYERLQAGQGEFLTELRPAVALFLRFDGIEYDADPAAGQKLDAYIRWVQASLVLYEGTLLGLTMGDKGSYLYLAFGAPLTHEDDAKRAALCALELRTLPEALSFITTTQIGLARGTMRTGAYGGTTRRTYGSLGDEVNLAARLMEHARPGEIVASGRIQGATKRLFQWQPLDEVRAKGKRDPIPVFVLLGEASISPIHLTEPAYVLPMIGRVAEFLLLEEKLRLARQGQGQVVAITGEAGMGKSRLVAEAIFRAQQLGFTVYGGECQSYGTATPYLVWQPIWRAFFGLVATDTLAHQSVQLARAIRELEPTLLPRLPLLAPVLGLPLPDNELTRSFTPELRKASREALLVDLLQAHMRTVGAVLLVLEDCHWLDGASHDLLEAMGRALWRAPVLLLLAYRPPELERLEAPRVVTLPYLTRLSLTELGETESAHLIATRLRYLHPHEERPPSAALITHLAERAQGNPFYLEELLNYLHDQGLDPYDALTLEQVELPSSLHRLILSRIDRLSESQKITLKVASIIGRLFRVAWLLGYYPTLGEATPVRADLDTLARLELTPLEREEPERAYLFKHVITREVAYESLPYATRAHLHEQLAAYLEGQGEHGVEGYLDLLAYHYALSENQGKAREALRRAGEAAQAAYAMVAALAYYERLLPLLQEPGDQAELHLRLGSVLETVGDWPRVEYHYQTARALVPPAGPLQAQSALALGKLHLRRGQYDEAQAWLTQALDQWTALSDPGGMSRVLTELGALACVQGDSARARPYLEQSRRLCQARGDRRGLAGALNWLGDAAYYESDWETARLLFEESLALCREVGNKEGIVTTLRNLGVLAMRQEQYAQGQPLLEESLALSRDIGFKMGMAYALWDLSLCQENLEVAQTLGEEALLLQRDLGLKPGIAHSLGTLGNLSWYQGKLGTAQVYVEESLVLLRELEDPFGTAVALSRLGMIGWLQGQLLIAQTYLEESLALWGTLARKRETAVALWRLGLVTWSHGQATEAQARLEESLGLWRASEEKRGVVMVLTALGALACHQGQYTSAEAYLEESLPLWKGPRQRKWGRAWTLGFLGATAYRREDIPSAQRHYRQSLMLAHEIGATMWVVGALVGVAILARCQEGAEAFGQATSLLAAAEGLRAGMGLALDPCTQALYDETLSATRAQLNEADFAAAWAKGQALTLDEAVAVALAENTDP